MGCHNDGYRINDHLLKTRRELVQDERSRSAFSAIVLEIGTPTSYMHSRKPYEPGWYLSPFRFYILYSIAYLNIISNTVGLWV